MRLTRDGICSHYLTANLLLSLLLCWWNIFCKFLSIRRSSEKKYNTATRCIDLTTCRLC